MTENKYIVSNTFRVNWAPKSVVDEVLQNVAVILATQIGTVPFSRKLGISTNLLDAPVPVSQAMLTREVIQKIGQFEPRAIIYTVRFEPSSSAKDGVIVPRLVIGVRE